MGSCRATPLQSRRARARNDPAHLPSPSHPSTPLTRSPSSNATTNLSDLSRRSPVDTPARPLPRPVLPPESHPLSSSLPYSLSPRSQWPDAILRSLRTQRAGSQSMSMETSPVDVSLSLRLREGPLRSRRRAQLAHRERDPSRVIWIPECTHRGPSSHLRRNIDDAALDLLIPQGPHISPLPPTRA